MNGIEAMIRAASGEVGYRESGTNNTKFNRWLGQLPGYPHDGFGYPWCHSFLSWCLNASGNTGAGPRTAGCETGVAWFKARKRFFRSPEVGDFVYYGPGGGTHVELVVDVSKTSIVTIGGNTGGSLDGRYFNGDGVYKKTVGRASPRIYGYGRPDYADRPSEPATRPGRADTWTETLVKNLPTLKLGASNYNVKTLRAALFARGGLSESSYGGAEGLKAWLESPAFDAPLAADLKLFQRQHKLDDDGVCGPLTWTAALRVA